MKNALFFAMAMVWAAILPAQIPNGYYDDAEGLEGDAMRTALRLIIDNHDVQSYGSLWNHFEETDRKANGKVWDMYSDPMTGEPEYEWTFGSNQCGNYSSEGDCYNREHSFPKSWFGEASPMQTDIFHLYPTDGWVNGLRGNYPYGVPDNATSTTSNGTKRGFSSYDGYTGVVFEPIDKYKGDLARTYFYMLTRYQNLVDGWNSPMLAGDDFTPWARQVMLEWHISDPVSEKEINRNNAAHDIQDNRNPYIDHPEWVESIWGSPIGVEETSTAQEIGLSYNAGQLTIRRPHAQAAQVFIYNLEGKIVASSALNNSTDQLDLTLPLGMYILRLGHGAALTTKKFVVLQ